MPPANLGSVASEEMLSFQNAPELSASASPDFDLEYLYKLILETPSSTRSTQEILPNPPFFHFLDPFILLPQIPASVDDTTNLCVFCSVLASLPPSTSPFQVVALPSNWHRIPQNVYDRGRKQWDFTPSEHIPFGVNGCPGVNMGDALRKRFAGLDRQDEPVLQDASSVISYRLLVRLS